MICVYLIYSPFSSTLPQALPYVGAFLDQIYSLEMSSKTYNPSGLVNFAKMTKLSAILRSALQYQEQHYTFEPRLDVSDPIGQYYHVTTCFSHAGNGICYCCKEIV